MNKSTVKPHTNFHAIWPGEYCPDCEKTISDDDGPHKCKVPAKRQQITLEVECLERLHDPANMGWQSILGGALGPCDFEASRHARVRVVASEDVIKRAVEPFTRFRDYLRPGEDCEDCEETIPQGAGVHRCQVPAKRQRITLEVECLERLHHPADMDWRSFLANALAAGDEEAAMHARVHLVDAEEVIR